MAQNVWLITGIARGLGHVIQFGAGSGAVRGATAIMEAVESDEPPLNGLSATS